MKTITITLTTLILMMLAMTAHAGAPQKSTVLFDIRGMKVEMPVKVEEAPDTIPASLAMAIEEEQSKEYASLRTKQFDLSQMSKPEADADDVTINTRAIFVEIIVNQRLEYLKCMFSKN